MKRQSCILSLSTLVITLLFFTSCSYSINKLDLDSVINSNNYSEDIIQYSPNIVFREGTEKDGVIVLTSNDFKNISPEYDENQDVYSINFLLKADCHRKFSLKTQEMMENGKNLTIWIGDELIWSAKCSSQIDSGEFMLAGDGIDSDSVFILFDKLKGNT